MMIGPDALLLLLLAQNFEQRGYVDNQMVIYPQAAPNDGGHVVGSALMRWEASYKFTPWFTLAGSVDARADTHHQTERDWRWTLDDRTIQRPAFALRRLSATLHKGKYTAEIGRQFIRWGKADILNPTDRFAPKDYLASVIDSDFLGVWATRATYESGANTIDLVWQPRFTPSRIPLLNQRWAVLPAEAAGIALTDNGAHYPGRSQFGARWNHVTSAYEFSASYFDGFNHLPSFTGEITPFPPSVGFTRIYPRLRLYGADAAVPLPWFTVKSEAAYFTYPTLSDFDQYALYVIQVERQVREWSFVGGYAGEAVTRRASNPVQFAPDRGFARSFVGRAGLTIDANRSFAIETVIRARGSFLRFEYSHLLGQHWRATGNLAWIRGDMADFLGQYHRNSYASLAIRYSF
jgi:hypothetical protein